MPLLSTILRPRSLTGRLRLASCLLLPLILGITAVILERAFSQSLEASTREQLKLRTYVLLGAAEAGGGQLWMPSTLQEPRFGQPGSGLYGLVSNGQGQLLWRSPSTLGLTLSPPKMPERTGEQRFGRTPDGLFFFSYPVIWETEDGRETPFLFTSLESPRFYQAELSAFRFHLWGGLSLLALLLLAAQGFILRWGLNPLHDLAEDLKAIEQGHTDKLKGHYPQEVAAMTTNLNLLLDGERRQRERYRNTLADLAHSLKTPLAVLRNQAADSAQPGLSEQVDRMDQIISHQLGRATSTPAHHLLQPVAVRTAAQRIGKAMEKVYRDKYQSFVVNGTELQFKGDERDLMEMLGNLIDNAFKYGRGRVRVCLAETEQQLLIRIEDDGAGVSPALHDAIQRRGSRADALQPGQGIGLSVVADILSGYGGRLEVGDSDWGGAAFELRLPR